MAEFGECLRFYRINKGHEKLMLSVGMVLALTEEEAKDLQDWIEPIGFSPVGPYVDRLEPL